MEKCDLFVGALVLGEAGGGGPKRKTRFWLCVVQAKVLPLEDVEPTQSSSKGEDQPVSAPAKGFGLKQSHTGSFIGLCAFPQHRSVTHRVYVNIPKTQRMLQSSR